MQQDSLCVNTSTILAILAEPINESKIKKLNEQFSKCIIKSQLDRNRVEQGLLDILQQSIVANEGAKLQHLFKNFIYLMSSFQQLKLKQVLSILTTQALCQLLSKHFSCGTILLHGQLLREQWEIIPIDVLQQYMESTQLTIAQFPAEEIDKRISRLVQDNKFGEILRLIKIFGPILHLVPLIDLFIQRDHVNELVEVVNVHPNLAKIVAEKLVACKKTRQATDLIKRFGLQKHDYPSLIAHQNVERFQSYYQPGDEWYRAEERLFGYDFMLIHLIKRLKDQGNNNIAKSVLKRHPKLLQYECCTELLSDQSEFEYIENPLLENDKFGVTEVVCFNQPDEYIHFSDYGLTQQNIHFVGADDQTLTHAIDSLTQAQFVGFDSEFNHQFDEFDQYGLALLQLATEDEIFLMDPLALADSNRFHQFCNDLLESSSIIKIGHSISNDLKVMQVNIKFKPNLQVNSFVDLATLYSEVKNLPKRSVSLREQALQLLGKKLSKSETFSNWARRPLRKAQAHYAAMDAYICLKLYQSLIAIQSQGNQSEEAKSNNPIPNQNLNTTTFEIDNLKYSVQNKCYFDNPQEIKFIVDNMLKKLSQFLRNVVGYDAAYMEQANHKEMDRIAKDQQRLILTRDKKFFKMNLQAPCYLLKDGNSTDNQYIELAIRFKLQPAERSLLSRCVKCNSTEIGIIPHSEAKLSLDFIDEESYEKIKDFWRCHNCHQIYWEGNSQKKSIQKFQKIIGLSQAQS